MKSNPILDPDTTYKNKEWLEEQIVIFKKSRRQIARECGVSSGTITYWFNEDYKKKFSVTRNKYYLNNKDKMDVWRKNYLKNYHEINGEFLRRYSREHLKDLRIQALNIIGGCHCVVCGDSNVNHLTIDHINNNGNIDRRNGLRSSQIIHRIVDGEYRDLENLRVLCHNHNFSRFREYLDLKSEEQKPKQRYQTKIWKAAFEFFGPCPCGETELKFLTVSHIHNDGAERRRNGERSGSDLLADFRKMGWPEDLKEDFCLECCNCNFERNRIYI